MDERSADQDQSSSCTACDRPAEEFGLCDIHLRTLEARLLAGLLRLTCDAATPSGRPCACSLTDLCSYHRDLAEQSLLKDLVEREMGRVTRLHRRQLSFQPPRDAAEARERLEAILARRRFVPSPDEAYTIAFDQIRFESRLAFGPSLIEGDEPVSFWYFEKRDGRFVVSYGVHGSNAGRDMPLASRRLFAEVMELLRSLPGYRETCEATGVPIEQPLRTIAYKLLRGAITIDEIRFTRFSPQAKLAMQSRESQQQMDSPSRSLLHLAPTEIARALLEAGIERPRVVALMRRMWPHSIPIAEAEAVVSSVLSAPSRVGRQSVHGTDSELAANSRLARYAQAVRAG